MIARIVFGITFIFSGFVKAVDPTGTAIKLTEYFTAFHLGFFLPLASLLAVVLAAAEFILGINTLLGLKARSTAVFDLLFMIVMTPVTLYLAIANPVKDCGCFGDALVISNWETFAKNVVLLLLAILLVRYNRRVKPVYTPAVQWLCILYSTLFIVAVSWIGLNYEPVLDFRPFRPGVNIPEGLTVPDNAPVNQYETTLIYEKNGEKRSFTLDNYPASDTTWHHVETINKLVSKGAEPLIADFTILDNEGENITDLVLDNPGYTFLLFSPNLETADDSEIDRINELYDYSVENHYPFYCVTASSADEISEWQDNTGAEYPFVFMDKTTIETIMRSNPGMMLLKEGTIYWKKSDRSLPDETLLNGRLDTLPLGQIHSYHPQRRLAFLAAVFILPLLLLYLTQQAVIALMNKIRLAKNKNRNNPPETGVAPDEGKNK